MFALAGLGLALGRSPFWRSSWTRGLTRFVFAVPLPALLVHLMIDLSSLPPVDARLLIAFFGSCFLVFGLGRVVGKLAFRLDGVGQYLHAADEWRAGGDRVSWLRAFFRCPLI